MASLGEWERLLLRVSRGKPPAALKTDRCSEPGSLVDPSKVDGGHHEGLLSLWALSGP